MVEYTCETCGNTGELGIQFYGQCTFCFGSDFNRTPKGWT